MVLIKKTLDKPIKQCDNVYSEKTKEVIMSCIENEIIKENIFDEIMEDLDYGMCATTREYFENVGTANGLDFTEDFDKIVEIMVEETFEMEAYEG
tara:strand:- start:497 stop:781 length:285 start_codon:yes stop_codon:yes gene_type:complete